MTVSRAHERETGWEELISIVIECSDSAPRGRDKWFSEGGDRWKGVSEFWVRGFACASITERFHQAVPSNALTDRQAR